MELIPLALEVTGAVGKEAKEQGKDLKHAYETRVLPVSNAPAAAAFNDALAYRISTTLQRGTAAIVYGVTQGEKAPMSAARKLSSCPHTRQSAQARRHDILEWPQVTWHVRPVRRPETRLRQMPCEAEATKHSAQDY